MKKMILPVIALGFLLNGCAAATIAPEPTKAPLDITILLKDLTVDRSYYKPGEPVKVSAVFESSAATLQQVGVVLTVRSLMSEIYHEEITINPNGGTQALDFTYSPPPETPRGYGVDIQVVGQDGTVLASDSTAFDVLDNWTQNPRYGFLTDYAPGRTDAEATMALLNRYHINGLQFYDWMYRHDQFLTDQDPYYDQWSPKPKSIHTVNALIDAAHQYGMAAMPYTAVYGSSRDFALKHPEMVLYTASGEMYEFGGDKMMIMDPRPESPWTAHLMDQFRTILSKTKFDGIHVDQYGDPKFGYDRNGIRYDIAPALVSFVDQTKELVEGFSPTDAVVFNLVNNWPVEDIAPSRVDFIYIEVWTPNTWFSNLYSLIVQAQKLSGGKPVVLACYIDPTYENNAILNEAVIFASGGGHLELGENNGMLAEAYFPSYHVISDALSETLQNYYDFSVRYQGVTGPGTTNGTVEYQGKIKIHGASTSMSKMVDAVWPIVRESKNSTAINLVNFLGIKQIDWTKRVPEKPNAMKDLQMTVETGPRKAAAVWYATPDQPQAHQPLQFQQEAGKLTVTVPSLDYWSMVVIDWAE